MRPAMACACLTVLCYGRSMAQLQPTDRTLAEIIKSAIDRNGDLQALKHQVAATEALLRQAGVRPAPTLEFEAGAGRPLGSAGDHEYRAGISQPLELGDKRSKRIQVAEFSRALAEAELSGRITDFAAQVEESYHQMIYERERLEALERALQAQRQALNLTAARVREGDAARLDTQLLGVEVSRMEAQRAIAEGRRSSAETEFRRLANIGAADPVPDLQTTATGAEFNLQEMQRRELQQRAMLRIARIIEQQGGAEIELTESQARPDITVSARYGHSSQSLDDQYGYTGSGTPTPLRLQDNTLTVGASVPLMFRSRSQGLIDAAVARARAGRARREYLEHSIPLEVAAAFQRWSAARRSRDLLSSQVLGPSQMNLEVIREAYQLGQLRLLDVLNEQRRFVETERAVLDARLETARALVELERATGEILP